MNIQEGIFGIVLIVIVCFYSETQEYISHSLEHQRRMDHLEYMERSELLMNRMQLEVSMQNLEESMRRADSLFNSY